MHKLEIINLLNEVKAIHKHYKKVIASSGENFNVFKILKMESLETRMHSAFLAELLNPDGSHGQKDEFLKEFIRLFKFKDLDFKTENAKVYVELHTGFIDEECLNGGRIDICIVDQFNRKLIIENKINAGDQKNQLLRYYNYDKDADLFYLTLDGKEPTIDSHQHLVLGEHFHLLSYKDEILKWLTLCREKSVMHPTLRECITQYINLIKHLTGQTINDDMKEELTELLTDNLDYLESAFLVAESIDGACEKLLEKLGQEVDEIAQELNMNSGFNIDIKFKANYRGIYFYPQNWDTLMISFQFWGYDKNLVFGICRKEIESGSLPEHFETAISSRFTNNGKKQNIWWPYYESVEQPYNNWSVYEPWKAIANGEMKRFIIDKVINIYKQFQGVDL